MYLLFRATGESEASRPFWGATSVEGMDGAFIYAGLLVRVKPVDLDSGSKLQLRVWMVPCNRLRFNRVYTDDTGKFGYRRSSLLASGTVGVRLTVGIRAPSHIMNGA